MNRPTPAPLPGAIPPQNLEAEESVLGAMMISPHAIERCAETGLEPQHFYRESHGIIYREALALHAEGSPVDAITLTGRLEQVGKIDQIGGRVRLHELSLIVPASANAHHYAEIVIDKAIMRGLIRAGGEIAQLGWEAEGEIPELIARAELFMSEIAEQGGNNDATPMNEGLADIGLTVKKARESGVGNWGLLTGFTELDAIMRGCWPGQFILAAARPGIGKSTFLLNVAENLADRGESSMFVSLEMSRHELQMRALARQCKIDSTKIEEGLLSDEEYERLRSGYVLVNERTQLIRVKDSGASSVAHIKAEARRMKRSPQGLSAIFLDYVQLMVAGGENRASELAQITRGLKQLAMELQIPVISASQLNRNLEHRQEKRPTLADLRESGSLEQDADVVVFLYRDAAYNPDAPPEKASDVELIVAKNRKGKSGVATVTFTERFCTFRNRNTNPQKGATK